MAWLGTTRMEEHRITRKVLEWRPVGISDLKRKPKEEMDWESWEGSEDKKVVKTMQQKSWIKKNHWRGSTK